MRFFVHFDIDAFYAQVEQKRRPHLRGKPVAVGGNSLRRSVVAAASYEARNYGVKSGMPIFMAKKLCPHCIFIPPDFRLYEKYSLKFYTLLYKYSPDVEVLSQDEAFMELTHCKILYPDPVKAAKEIRKEISRELGLKISAGAGSSKIVAKLATSRAKPDGFLYIPPEYEIEFIESFKLDEIPGIGHKTAEALRRLGITSTKDFRKASPLMLRKFLGKRGEDLYLMMLGKDYSQIEPPKKPKSISRGYTLERDIYSLRDAVPHLIYLCDSVSSELRREGGKATKACLKIKRSDFSEISMCTSVFPPFSDFFTLYNRIKRLAEKSIGNFGIRLLSVAVSGIYYEPTPTLSKFKEEELMGALDRLRKKYGFHSVSFASEAKVKDEGVFVFKSAKEALSR